MQLSDLREAIDEVFRHLEENGVLEMELKEDYYWYVDANDAYDMLKDPESIFVGQLTHDWERLQQIGEGSMPPVGYALVWASALLRRVGETAGC